MKIFAFCDFSLERKTDHSRLVGLFGGRGFTIEETPTSLALVAGRHFRPVGGLVGGGVG